MRDLNDPKVLKAVFEQAQKDAKASVNLSKKYENLHKSAKIEVEKAQKAAEKAKIWHKIGFFVPIVVFFIGMTVLCLGWV